MIENNFIDVIVFVENGVKRPLTKRRSTIKFIKSTNSTQKKERKVIRNRFSKWILGLSIKMDSTFTFAKTNPLMALSSTKN